MRTKKPPKLWLVRGQDVCGEPWYVLHKAEPRRVSPDDWGRGGYLKLCPADFEALYRMRGREIEVSDPGGSVRCGVAGDVGSDGTLELHLESGDLARIVAGDVTLRPQAMGGAPAPQGQTG